MWGKKAKSVATRITLQWHRDCKMTKLTYKI